MAKYLGVYKCEVCGNIVEVLFEGNGELVCCGLPMEIMNENTVDASFEKHIPVGSRQGNILTVKIGSEPHPMNEKHYIEWVEVLVGNKAYREFLKPDQEPQVSFCIEDGGEPLVIKAYCNLHGLWKS